MPFKVTDNVSGKVITFQNKPSQQDMEEAFGSISEQVAKPLGEGGGEFRGGGITGTFPARPETLGEAISIGAGEITGESSKETLEGIFNIIRHPIQTVEGLAAVASGAISKALPEGVTKDFLQAQDVIRASDEETASAVWESLKEDYGGAQNIRNTIANKPLQAGLDALLLTRALTSGTSRALTRARLPKVGKIVEAIDPLKATKAVAGKIAKGARKGVGGGISEVFGVTTGTSASVVKEAFIGGEKFRKALRGKVTGKQIRDAAVTAFNKLKLQRDTAFNSSFKSLNMGQELNIGAVKNAVKDVKTKFGIVQNEKGKIIRSTIDKGEWKKIQDVLAYLDEQGNIPTDLTGAGFHKLKRFLDSTSKGMINAKGQSTVGGKMVGELRDATTKQLNNIPGYTDMNRRFSLRTTVMDDIDNVLKLRGKSVETSIAKITNSMRQNKDYARAMVDLLEDTSGTEITELIAGLSLNPKVPVGHLGRVLTGMGALGTAGGTVAGIVSPWFMTILSVGSPRLVGEMVNAIGRTSRAVKGVAGQASLPVLGLAQTSKVVPEEANNALQR